MYDIVFLVHYQAHLWGFYASQRKDASGFNRVVEDNFIANNTVT